VREDQIVRYGRQILLRELGGRGQDRLLAVPVRVRAAGPAFDDAIAYLLAGGSPVELVGPPPQGFLAGVALDSLNPDAAPSSQPVVEVLSPGLTSNAPMQVVIGAGVAFRNADACEACWSLTAVTVPPGPGPAGLGSLAALAVQRLILGWSEPLGLILWNGERFETGPICRCSSHSNSQ
jgi:hypothetical protein